MKNVEQQLVGPKWHKSNFGKTINSFVDTSTVICKSLVWSGTRWTVGVDLNEKNKLFNEPINLLVIYGEQAAGRHTKQKRPGKNNHLGTNETPNSIKIQLVHANLFQMKEWKSYKRPSFSFLALDLRRPKPGHTGLWWKPWPFFFFPPALTHT